MKFFLAFLFAGCAFNPIYSMENQKTDAEVLLPEAVSATFQELKILESSKEKSNQAAAALYSKSCFNPDFVIPNGRELDILREKGFVAQDGHKAKPFLQDFFRYKTAH